MAKKEDRIFFPNLDGFRFLSFLIVFFVHGFKDVIYVNQSDGFIITNLKMGLFQSGQLGVSFFFVLSGFLITYLILTEQIKFGKFDAKAFYIRRSLRIFPLYFAFLIVCFFILPFLIEINLPNPFYYFLFFSNFDIIKTGGAHAILDVTWSVSVEEQFYLFGAIIFFFLNPKYYIYVFTTIIIGSAFFRWNHQSDGVILLFHTLSVISELAIGGLTAYLAIFNERFKRFFSDLSVWVILSAYILIAPILLFSRFFYTYSTFGRIILGFAIAFILTEQNYSKNSFYKMKNFKIFSFFGKYTYGLYLLHPLVIYLVFLAAKKLDLEIAHTVQGVGLGVLGLLISILVCYLSYEYFEYPFLKMKERFSYLKTYKSEISEQKN